MHCVSTESPTNIVKNQSKNHFGPQYKNLASIIRGFKSAVTAKARRMHHEFEWQARFHDNIIQEPGRGIPSECHRIIAIIATASL